MHVEKRTVNVTTDGSGNATAFADAGNGLLDRIVYIKDGGANPFAAGVDFTITMEDTAESLWTQLDVNASAVVAPRQATHSNAGVATLYAAGGTAVQDKIAIDGRIKIAIAQGGATKVGQFIIYLL